MILLDHLILRVRNLAASLPFYRDILGFAHEGKMAPFESIRINPHLTLDLMQDEPRDTLHLAFSLPRQDFDAVHARLRKYNIAYGNSPFDRSGAAPAPAQGARGMAFALYFYDPDRHNLEIRCYEATASRCLSPGIESRMIKDVRGCTGMYGNTALR
jgi:catechol 2,3-dioxygenase-like lactoylglutathione lyase family enzyme